MEWVQRSREEYEQVFHSILDKINDSDLIFIVTPRLAELMQIILGRNLATLQSKRSFQFITINEENIKITNKHIVYISFPRVDEILSIIKHYQTLQDINIKTIYLYVTSGWNELCKQVLNHWNVLQKFQLEIISLSFFTLDYDLFTLGYKRCLYDLYLYENNIGLQEFAMGLYQITKQYGAFSCIKFKGELSRKTIYYLSKLQEVDLKSTERNSHKKNSYHTLILLDRSIDFVSALTQPLIYEGLLQEKMDFIGTTALLPEELHQTGVFKCHTKPLDSKDIIFQAVRFKHIYNVQAQLRMQAIQLKDKFQEFQSKQDKLSPAEISDFVRTIPEMKDMQQSITQHLEIMDYLLRATREESFIARWQWERSVMDYDVNAYTTLKEFIYQHQPLLSVLRCVCLYSLINDGYSPAQFHEVKQLIIHTYGYELMPSLDTLTNLGLLVMQKHSNNSKSIFNKVSEGLKSIDLGVDVTNPNTSAYSTGGYAPISCRLVEEIIQSENWLKINTEMEYLPGPRAEIKQKSKITNKSKPTTSKKKQRILVCYIGGITPLEVNVLRWMCTKYSDIEITIAATEVMDSESFLCSCLEHIETINPIETSIQDKSGEVALKAG